MAGDQLNRSRRALLGAAVGLPLVARAGAGEAAGALHHEAAEWEAALAAFAAAEAELMRYEGWCSGRPFEEQERLEGGYDLRSDAMYAALRRLMAAPAPDARALAVKLDLAAAHELATLDGGEACLKAIRRDAWRMAGVGDPCSNPPR